jgi:hypothetical protein
MDYAENVCDITQHEPDRALLIMDKTQVALSPSQAASVRANQERGRRISGALSH